MKLIPKHQQGGAFSSLFATYTPFIPQATQQSQNSTQQASTNTKQDSGIDKQLMGLLDKVDGLPNEMNSLAQSISSMFALADLGGSMDASSIGSQYAQIQYGIKVANFNKKEYDKAYNLVVRNGGLNEVALGDYGEMYAYNKDKELKTISVQDYLKNKDQYVPITNSQLLWLRAHDPQFANNNQVLGTVSNGIGMKEVMNQVKSNLSNLGSSTEEIQGMVHKVGDKVISGLEALRKMAENGGKAAVDGIYKVKPSNTNSQKQAQAAIEFLFQSLSPNAQQLLILKGGDSQNPTKGALNLLSKRIMAMMSDKISYSETYDDDFDAAGKPVPKSKSKSGEDDLKQNIPMAFQNGGGYSETIDIIPGGNIGGRVVALTQGIPGSDNKPFEGKYLSELNSSGIGPMMDTKNATMGGYKIAIPDQVEILYNKMHSVFWPVKDDGVTPDFSDTNIEAIKAANEEIANNNIDPNSVEAIEILKKHGVPNPSALKRFFVFDAMTNNKALGVDRFDDTPLLQTVSDYEYDQYENSWEAYFSKDKSKRKMDLDHFHWYNPNDWFGGYDDVYKGTVWVPMYENYMNALAGTGEHIKTEDFNDYERRQQEYDRSKQAQLNYVNPSEYE